MRSVQEQLVLEAREYFENASEKYNFRRRF